MAATKVVNTSVAVMRDGFGVYSTCPVCGFQKDMHVFHLDNLGTPQLVQCGSRNDGTGCHAWYVMRVTLTATVTGHKISD